MNKWKNELKEAIDLSIKNNKKEYLPLFYMVSLESCAGNTECMCKTANKVLESAKVANASKLPFKLYAYFILIIQCKENFNEQDVINEFNKLKSALSDNNKDITELRELNSTLGYYYLEINQYPKALVYLRKAKVYQKN